MNILESEGALTIYFNLSFTKSLKDKAIYQRMGQGHTAKCGQDYSFTQMLTVSIICQPLCCTFPVLKSFTAQWES